MIIEWKRNKIKKKKESSKKKQTTLSRSRESVQILLLGGKIKE